MSTLIKLSAVRAGKASESDIPSHIECIEILCLLHRSLLDAAAATGKEILFLGNLLNSFWGLPYPASVHQGYRYECAFRLPAQSDFSVVIDSFQAIRKEIENANLKQFVFFNQLNSDIEFLCFPYEIDLLL